MNNLIKEQEEKGLLLQDIINKCEVLVDIPESGQCFVLTKDSILFADTEQKGNLRVYSQMSDLQSYRIELFKKYNFVFPIELSKMAEAGGIGFVRYKGNVDEQNFKDVLFAIGTLSNYKISTQFNPELKFDKPELN